MGGYFVEERGGGREGDKVNEYSEEDKGIVEEDEIVGDGVGGG